MNSKTRFREEYDVEDAKEKRTDRTEWKAIIEKLLLIMLEQHYSLIRSKNVLAILLFSKERTATNIKLLSDTIVKFVDVIIS